MLGGGHLGGVYALLVRAGPRRPNIATGAHASVGFPRAGASSSVRRLARDVYVGVVPITREYIAREEVRLRGAEGGVRAPLRLAGE